MLPSRKGYSFDDVLLVPKKTRVTTRSQIDLQSTLVKGLSVNIPIISANTPWCTESELAASMARLGAFGVIHRMCPISHQVEEIKRVKRERPASDDASRDQNNTLLVGAAIGTNHEYYERALAVTEAGADILVIDVAHGHSEQAIEALTKIRNNFPFVKIIAGNVATAEATLELIEAGADAIKVGIGPGSICTTRIVTGSGIPQITAIHDCSIAARDHNIPVIADGGIKNWGDIAKAIAAGANSVMLGGILAGTTQSAAKLVERNGKKFKVSDGFASLGMKNYRKLKKVGIIPSEKTHNFAPEGIEMVTPCKGDVEHLIREACAALQSSLSYSGSMSICEFHCKAEFIEISAAGYQESKPHMLDRNQLEYQLSDFKDGKLN